MHVMLLPCCTHSPLPLHESGKQDSTGMSQVLPVSPEGHMQEKPSMPSTQVPALQGAPSQSSMSVSQTSPVKPPGHKHWKELSADAWQVPPLVQGDASHGEIRISQLSPSKSSAHMQVYWLGVSRLMKHSPPFKQGVFEH